MSVTLTRQDPGCQSACRDSGGWFARVLLDDQCLGLHQRHPEAFGRHGAVVVIIPGHVRAVESSNVALLPAREMNGRQIAKPDEGLGISADRAEVESIDDAIGPFAASGTQHGAHIWITKGLVQVRQSILVAPSEVVTPAIEGVGRNFHAQAPVRQDGSASLNLDRVGATRG